MATSGDARPSVAAVTSGSGEAVVSPPRSIVSPPFAAGVGIKRARSTSTAPTESPAEELERLRRENQASRPGERDGGGGMRCRVCHRPVTLSCVCVRRR
jgi:hypothetical protein